MSAALSNGIDYFDKLSHQQAHILGAFMAVAYWEYVLEFNPELAKRPEMRALTNRWRENPLYVAVEDFLTFDMQKLFTSIANTCPEYVAELDLRLISIKYHARNVWEQARKADPNSPELIFPNLEPTIKENQK